MQTLASLQSSAAWLGELNKAWRSVDLRREFEAETGFAPLVTGNSLSVEAQTASGQTSRYHYEFRVWATKRLGLKDLAPEEIRGQFE